jgi:hypothetical protein
MKTLDEIKTVGDDDAVRIWLADRGLVAIHRSVANDLATPDGGSLTYDAKNDRYIRRVAK